MHNDSTVITSSQNRYVSLARALQDRKQRQKHRLYRIDGVKLFCEAVSRGAVPEAVLFCNGQRETVCVRARELYGLDTDGLDCACLDVAASVFDKLTDENAPEGVICIMKYDAERHRELCGGDIEVGDTERVLLLESVRDPQNVGAILRAAAAFSVDRVIMSKDCADIYNPKTQRASMGAIFSLRIDRVDGMAAAIECLTAQGRRVFAAALDARAKKLGELDVRGGDCVVIGNEGHGISGDVLSCCTKSVYIPMSDAVESLNAATAAAVLCWEFFGKK